MSKGFGSRLKEIREVLGHSQSKMAELIGKPQNTISKYENDKAKNIAIDDIYSFANLNINLNWLFNGEGNMFLNDNSSNSKSKPSIDTLDKKLEIAFKRIIELENKLLFGDKEE